MDYLYRPDFKNKVVQMFPFTTMLSIDKASNQPLFLQIANAIVNIIREGQIKPGTMLPGTRELAKQLNVHRKTVIAAYDELYAQSWTEVLPRKGVIIAQNLPELHPKAWDNGNAAIDQDHMGAAFYKSDLPKNNFTTAFVPQYIIDEGYPDSRIAPLELLNREYRSRLKHYSTHKAIPGSLAAGSLLLREALVDYLSESRALHLKPSNILITHGAQMSIYIAANLLLRPGDGVIVGDPSYHLANRIFERIGANIIKVPVDAHGMDMDAIAEACKKNNVRMLYVIPHHHHPTTVTLSPERRMRLLQLSQKFDFAIVEDDYDYEFHYNSAPYLPLVSSKNEGRVIYIGSFSKSIAPSVRIGFMTAPADFIQEATHLRFMIDLRGDHLLEDALAALITNGDISRHLKKSNKLYYDRRNNLCDLFETQLKDVVRFEKPSGGMAVWVQFDPAYPLANISENAAANGLYISRSYQFHGNEKDRNSIRMGFASLTETEMKAAIEILCRAITK